MAEEDNKNEVVEELEDDGKIHFPLAGLIIVGVIVLAMVICLIIIGVNGGVR